MYVKLEESALNALNAVFSDHWRSKKLSLFACADLKSAFSLCAIY